MKLFISSDRSFGEFLLTALIVVAACAYIGDVFNDGMVISGVIVAMVCSYVALLWRERSSDERDIVIASRIDRALYILTLAILLASIVYKTFAHVSYMSEVVVLMVLSVTKILMTLYAKKYW